MNFENIINGLSNAAGAVENDLAAISGQPENSGTVSVGKIIKVLKVSKNRTHRLDARVSEVFKKLLNESKDYAGNKDHTYLTQSDFINYLLSKYITDNKKLYNTLTTDEKRLVRDKFYSSYYDYIDDNYSRY